MKYKANAKVNIFLKIVGIRGEYHEIISRFVLVYNLFDELSFLPKKNDEEFELHGDFGCELEQNTIYKGYLALCRVGYEKEVKKFFNSNALHVNKKIPSFAGLGGGSSDVATFLHMVNKKLNLKLTKQELAKIGLSVGADVPFFVYGYKSANVSGIGEKVEEFEEEALSFEIFTPDIKCDTGKIYQAFRQDYKINVALANDMKKMKSRDLLSTYSDIELNDLLGVALEVEKSLESQRKKEWFFSGSGSSFFKTK
ncbi:MAG: 4-(cytidine 5'-diphospho)-2-C-methyl-D-erythritol kinase [Epsilonproteobacteria bacterium]|nr:4-(cytidine 5'-diphospho)-2-C-methyl-D-erythritol kinase [Campylobacterota bacterium]